jgi:hypothetical protein
MAFNNRLPPIFLGLSAGMAGLVLLLISSVGWLGDRLIFILLSMLLLGYLWLEVRRLRHLQPNRWLLNPAVLGSFMTFVLSYSASNFLFMLPEDTIAQVGLMPEVTPAMVKLMWLALIGAIAMWLGYWSPLASKLSNPHASRYFAMHFLPKFDTVRSLTIPALVAVSLAARLIQIRLGVFGYSGDYSKLIEHGAITQYLSMAAMLGKLALVIVALRFFSGNASSGTRFWFFTLIGYEVFFGFFGGFKSQVAMPFVIAAFCQYLKTGRVSRKWVLLFVAALTIAYAVIEPFRAARHEDDSFRSTSFTRIFDTMFGSATPATRPVEQAGTLVSLANRSNLTYVGSLGIEFADSDQSLPSGSPNFLGDILMAPLHAWVPRLLWEDKPLGTLGLWYTQVVMGFDIYSSTAMGPVTYLYLAGGALGVFLGFFFIGIVQRAFFFMTQPWASTSGGVVFLGMLSTFVIVDSAFNSIVIALFRDLPLLLLLQFILFGRRARRLSH